MMKKLALIAATAALFASGPAYAAIRTTILAVKNMTCVTCGPIVKKSLSRVPGVTAVEVSTEGHTATITYRSEEHTSELRSLMRISYAVFCLKKKTQIIYKN